ncbi:MAG: xanthine dehydrogenase family protein molybdopterin-binding subunit [Thermoprotei archaeon]
MSSESTVISAGGSAIAGETHPETEKLVGKPLPRTEDRRLLTGKGRFIGDIAPPGVLYAQFVRSPYARALIHGVNASKALELPGVAAVFSAQDLSEVGHMPTVAASKTRAHTVRYVLASGEVRYVGEAVAVVIAEKHSLSVDAAELVEVEYEPLEPVVDPVKALEPGSPKVHGNMKDNVAERVTQVHGDVDSAFNSSYGVLELELINQRVAPAPMEPRGVVASFDQGSGELTVWATTQDPHGLREALSDILKIPEPKIRVIAPDVGGAFGSKISVYPEDVAVCFAAMRLGRPVKWTESRRENMAAGTHGRGQVQRVKLAYTKEGRISGLKVEIISDAGAYATAGALENPELTVAMATGVYKVPAYASELVSVLTNKVPQDAYRGAGRPEAAYLIERAMDALARRLNTDPLELRRRNFIPKSEFPYRTASGFTYDGADYESAVNRLLEICDYDALKKRVREMRANGMLAGIGVCVWTEITGFGPRFPQTAAVSVSPKGEVTVFLGGHPHGQGHKTPMTQIVCDELGVSPESVTVMEGDTSLLPWSSLTAGSRSAALTGSAVLLSARKIRDKMSAVASRLLKSESSEMVFSAGEIYDPKTPAKRMSFSEVASACYDPGKLPSGLEPTLYEYTAYAPANYAFPSGAHLALVSVDRDSGEVKVLEYYAVDDCGRILNPLLAEGQVHGGVVQGLGQAVLEKVVYDGSGQLLTSTFADYTIPSTTDVPKIRWAWIESSTYANAMGIKGIGEAGTIAATPTVVNAVQDALHEYNVLIDSMPLTSEYVHSIVQSAVGKK